MKGERPSVFYLIGICGSGMGGVALLLKEAGFEVKGSDYNCNPPMSELLLSKGIEILKGWDPANLNGKIDKVIVGNVCRSNNPEVIRAKELGIELISMPDALEKYILKDKKVIVVAGTHGKSTTTALVSYLLMSLGENPGFLVGGILENFGLSSMLGKGQYFVLEGDEYDTAFFDKVPKIWRYPLDYGILTSIDYDHADIYPNLDSYLSSFKVWLEEKFVGKKGKVILAWAGDPLIKELFFKVALSPIWYGVEGDCNDEREVKYNIVPLGFEEGKGERFIFKVKGGREFRGVFSCQGLHNLRNLCAALGLLNELALFKEEIIDKALLNFKGVKQRQSLIHDSSGIKVFFDFAHHPTAIRETILSFKRRFPNYNLLAVYQPSSATACRNIHKEEYIKALLHAERVIITEPKRREIPPEEKLRVKEIVEEINKKGGSAKYLLDSNEIIEVILNELLDPPLVILFMSNGPFDNIPYKLKERLAEMEEVR